MKNTKHLNKKVIATSMLIVGVIMPLVQIPQIRTLYSTKVTAGLSLETWVMYLFLCFIPLAYGIAYKLTPLIISNILWTIVNIVVVVGIIKYGVAQNVSSMDSLIIINSIGKLLSLVSLLLFSVALILFSLDLLKLNHAKAM